MAQAGEPIRPTDPLRVQHRAQQDLEPLVPPAQSLSLAADDALGVGAHEMVDAIGLQALDDRALVPWLDEGLDGAGPGGVPMPDEPDPEEDRDDGQAHALALGDEVLDGREDAVGGAALA